MLVLASDMSGILNPFFAMLGWGVFFYLLTLVSAKVVSHRPMRGAFLAALAWGFVFPLFQIIFTWAREPKVLSFWVEILPASIVTAAMLAWASRSWIPTAGVSVGYLLASLLETMMPWPDNHMLFALTAVLPWNIPVATAMLWWAVRERARWKRGVWACASCGYGLTGLSGLRARRCPECGEIRSESMS